MNHGCSERVICVTRWCFPLEVVTWKLVQRPRSVRRWFRDDLAIVPIMSLLTECRNTEYLSRILSLLLIPEALQSVYVFAVHTSVQLLPCSQNFPQCKIFHLFAVAQHWTTPENTNSVTYFHKTSGNHRKWTFFHLFRCKQRWPTTGNVNSSFVCPRARVAYTVV